MTRYIAISGPSSTGKTSLAEDLSTHLEMKEAEFSPDLYNTVWMDLVSKGIFQKYDEIIKDSEYVCVYIIRLINYYKSCLDKYKESDKLIIMDCCWLDMLAYGLRNMWSSRPIKSLQEDIIGQILSFHESIDRIYLTSFDESKHKKQKFKEEFRVYSLKDNRNLELRYYEMFKNFNHVVPLPSSDITDSSLFIIEDLKNLGYV